VEEETICRRATSFGNLEVVCELRDYRRHNTADDAIHKLVGEGRADDEEEKGGNERGLSLAREVHFVYLARRKLSIYGRRRVRAANRRIPPPTTIPKISQLFGVKCSFGLRTNIKTTMIMIDTNAKI
jgi:hypothetical protein